MNCPLQTAVEQVCWHPQVPTRLATISRDADVKIWDTRTGKTVMVIPTGASHVNINLAWSPDGVFLAAGTRDDHITIIEPGKGAGAKILKRMKFPMEVNEFAWSANSQYLFLTTLQGSVQVRFPGENCVRGDISVPDQSVLARRRVPEGTNSRSAHLELFLH
jgi:THO complex subunit 3